MDPKQQTQPDRTTPSPAPTEGGTSPAPTEGGTSSPDPPTSNLTAAPLVPARPRRPQRVPHVEGIRKFSHTHAHIHTHRERGGGLNCKLEKRFQCPFLQHCLKS